MDSVSANVARPRVATFADLFTPKLVTVLREGYGLHGFRADIVSGLTVAIVALPLSMAIAIASGVTPDRGLYTAIVGGFVVSAARRQPVSDRAVRPGRSSFSSPRTVAKNMASKAWRWRPSCSGL